MRKILLIVFISLTSNFLEAKEKKSSSFKNRYIKGFCVNFLTDFGRIPDYQDYKEDYLTNGLYYAQTKSSIFGLNTFFVGFNNHFILKEVNKDKSISLNIFPTIGASKLAIGYGSLTLPVFINYNVGNVATYATKKNHGFTIGIGFEYLNLALIKAKNDEYLQSNNEGFKYYNSFSRIQPAMNFGYRYYNNNDKAKEINLKIGAIPQNTYDRFGQAPSEKNIHFLGKIIKGSFSELLILNSSKKNLFLVKESGFVT